jgi:aspartate beta-hydroxylase
MTIQSLYKVQASLKLQILFWMVRIRRNRTELDQKSLLKIKEYLRVSLGLVKPTYSQPLQRPLHLFPGLTAKPWYETSDFEWTTVLENDYETIKEDFHQIYNSEGFRIQQQGLAGQGQWQVYYLYFYGRQAKDNCRRCPKTAQLLESISAISNAGLALFSVLPGGTRLVQHCGPINTKLRCHLALSIPAQCGIRVGTDTRSWEEGKCLVFDDSFEHEAWNLSQETRAVLIIDFWHPDLTAGERRALEQIMYLSPKARREAKAVLKKKGGS